MAENNYLFIEDLDLLKEKIKNNPHLYIRLVEQCKRYEDVILTEKHPKGSSSFIGMAAANLSLLTLLSEEKRWKDEAKRWIFTALSYENWGHTNLVYSDINSSWVLFGLSLSYSWMDNFLSDNEKEIFRKRLLLQGTRKWNYKEKHTKIGWPVRYWQNHNWLNFTGLATVAYALKSEYPEECNMWLEGAAENFKKIFSLMPDDGSDYEGVVYWRYGIIWLIQYAELIKTQESIDLFKKSNFLKNTFYYRLYQCSPVFEKNYNFGDCHDTRSGHSSAVYFKLASEYKIHEAQWMGENVLNNLLYREAMESKVTPGILPEAFLEMLWFDPTVKKKNPTSMYKSKFFPDLGLLSCRSSWSPDAFAFSVKAGCPGGKKQWEKSWELQEKEGFTRRSLCHQHGDDGSFILWKGSNNYVVDEGYNREVKAADHNMVLFDGKGYKNEGRHDIFKKASKDQQAKMEVCLKQREIIYSVANLENVYDKQLGVVYFKRHFFYTGGNDLVIFDEFLSETSKEISWQMHTEDHLIAKHGQFMTKDMDFIFTPLVKNGHSISRESKVISAVLNKQEPDKKTRRKMENISFNIDNRRCKTRFLNIIQTGPTAKDKRPQLIEDKNWIGLSITDDSIVETFLFSKTIETQQKHKIQGIDVESSSSFIYIKDQDGKYMDSFHADGELIYSGVKIENSECKSLL